MSICVYLYLFSAVCSKDFFYSSSKQECAQCIDKNIVDPINATVVIVVIFLIALVYVLLWKPLFVVVTVNTKDLSGSAVTASSSTTVESPFKDVQNLNQIRQQPSQHNRQLFVIRMLIRLNMINSNITNVEEEDILTSLKQFVKVQILPRMKIYTTFYQILLSIPFVLDIKLPKIYSKAIAYFRILNFTLFTDIGTPCYSLHVDYVDILVMSTVFPICVVVLIFLIQYIHIACYKLQVNGVISRISECCSGKLSGRLNDSQRDNNSHNYGIDRISDKSTLNEYDVNRSFERKETELTNIIFKTSNPLQVEQYEPKADVGKQENEDREHNQREEKEEEQEVLKYIALLQSRYFSVFLLFTYLSLPGITSIIFRTFPCTNVDPDNVLDHYNYYMRADYSISCDSDRYYFGCLYSVCMIIVYPICVPLYYWYLLVSAKDYIGVHDSTLSTGTTSKDNNQIVLNATATNDDDSSNGSSNCRRDSCGGDMMSLRAWRISCGLSSIKLLFDAYHSTYWYWEIIETTQRLFLTGVLVVIMQGSSIQILIAIILIFLYTKLYIIYQPFKNIEICKTKEVIQWQMFVVYFMALLIKTNTLKRYQTFFNVVLLLVTFFNLIYDMSLIVIYLILKGIDRNQIESKWNGQQSLPPQQQGKENRQSRNIVNV